MTQNEKDLVLKDLCARLPYGVIVNVKGFDFDFKDKLTQIYKGYGCSIQATNNMPYDIEQVKPYLFPLSSMTDEQKQEYTYIVNYISSDDTENWKEGEFIYVEQFTQLMHFYHINHLDYMGLIPMGLAIDATGLNIY